jgi:hypothetical protein
MGEVAPRTRHPSGHLTGTVLMQVGHAISMTCATALRSR